MHQINNAHPLVSVIVPVFNEEHFLKRCTDSIISQTYRNLEIVLVDDGSTDKSGILCDEIQHTDKRIKVIHEENKGLSAARNTGVFHSHGDFVAFIDSDDYIDSDYIEKMVQAATCSNDIDLVITDFQTNNPKFPNPVPRKEQKISGVEAVIKAEESSLNLAFIVAWDKLYRRRLFDNIQFPVGKIHEDEFTYYKFLYCSRKVCWINSPGYHYCLNHRGITAKQGSAISLDTLGAFADKTLFYLDTPNLKKLMTPLASNEFIGYFLLMARKRWTPQDKVHKEYYNSICNKILHHKRSIVSTLSWPRKILFKAAYDNPRFTSFLYFILKQIKNRYEFINSVGESRSFL